MSKTFLKAFTFLAVAALVATASAGARDSRTITIGHSATVENGTLAAGNYIISWKSRSPEAGVTFQSAKDQGVVMTAHGRIEKRSDYFDRDMVVYDETPDGSRRLLELRFAGSNKALVLIPAAAASRPSKPGTIPSSRLMPQYVPGIGYIFDNTWVRDPLQPSPNPTAGTATGKPANRL